MLAGLVHKHAQQFIVQCGSPVLANNPGPASVVRAGLLSAALFQLIVLSTGMTIDMSCSERERGSCHVGLRAAQAGITGVRDKMSGRPDATRSEAAGAAIMQTEVED